MKRELRGPLRELLDEPRDVERIESIRTRLRVSRAIPRRARFGMAAPLGIAAAIALAVVIVWSTHEPATETARSPDPTATHAEEPSHLVRVDGAPFESMSGESEGSNVALDDGSVVALAPRVTVDVVENVAERLVLAQGIGRVTYDVRPGGSRQWTVDAGLATIDVLGTSFTIDRSADEVRVDVTRGHVRVRSERSLETLGPGESTVVELVVPEPEPEPEPVVETETRPPPAPAREAPAWRALADRGEPDEAFAAIGEAGWADAVASSDASSLLTLADLARASGHPLLARDPLRRFLELHARDARAGAAALALGRLELDAHGSADDAVDALERARTLGVPVGQRSTLEARLAEAYQRAGHATEAREAATRYLAIDPDGVSADEMRALLGEDRTE